MSSDSAHRHKPRIWRLLRLYFRRFRIMVWLVLLLIVGIFVYLNQIGLPDFVKKPLLENLRVRGIDLQFSRLRLDWINGIVADHVRFGRPDNPESPYLTVREIKVGLDRSQLKKLTLQIESLTLRNGILVWPLLEPNHPPRQISLQIIETDLRFLPGDQWELDNFRAIFSTANIRLSGTLTNASAINEWQFLRSKEPIPAQIVDSRLRQFADLLEKIKFSTPPELNLDLRGDARDLQSFSFRLLLSAPDANTPWGAFQEGRLSLKLHPPTNMVSRADLNLEAAHAETRWGSLTNLVLQIRGASNPAETNLVHALIKLNADSVHTKWASARNASLAGSWTHSLTNPVPISGQGEIFCGQATTEWGSLTNGHLHARLDTPPSGTLPTCDPSWGWWTNLHPYAVEWQCDVGSLVSPKLQTSEVVLAGNWLAPVLNITNFHAGVTNGSILATGDLNVASRALHVEGKTAFDPRRQYVFLPEEVKTWLQQFTWQASPEASATASMTLPPWTDSNPDWHAVEPSIVFDGQFRFPGGASFRGIEVSSAQSHIIYSNLVLTVPDLYITRPEGELRASHQANGHTKDIYWSVNSSIDPGVLRPLVPADQQAIFDLITLTEPPHLSIAAWGNSLKPDDIQARGSLAVSNLTFRGEHISGLQTAFYYSNQQVHVIEPRAQRGEERISADYLLVDIPAEVIYLTNGYSTADPMFVTRAIGPQVAKAIEPYQFGNAPKARVHGVIPLRGEEKADLYFDVEGGPFHWWKLNLARVKGKVHWKGTQLTLQDVEADFYGGRAAGIANIDLSQPKTTIYDFAATATSAMMQPLVRDLFGFTNRLEGTLDAQLVVTHASSAVTNDMQGYGKASLRDGFLWELPILGILTPLVNGISPGLANSRATSATCSFAIENAVVKSKDLVIRAEGMRLNYGGTVDLEGRTEARVEAEVMRDMWLVGPLVSTVLWPVTKMFEYKVSGTLGEPKLEPLYIFPKLIRIPLQPLKTLKSLLPEGGSNRTNSPPTLPKLP